MCIDLGQYWRDLEERVNVRMELMWQIGVIATGVLSALSQVVGKRQVDRMSAFQSGLLRDATVLFLAIAVCIYLGEMRIGWEAGIMFLMGVTESVAIAAYFSAQREHMAATAIFSYPFSQLLIVLLSAIFFAEWKYFDVRTTAGIFNILALIISLGLMMIYQQREGKATQKFRWSWMLLFSAVVVSISSLESKWAMSIVGYSPSLSMLYEFCGLVFGGIVYVWMRKQGMKLGLKNIGWGVLQGLLFGVATIWYLALLKDTPLGIASLVRRVTIVILTASAGLWGYGEAQKLSKSQWVTIGLGMVVFAIVMMVNR